MAVIQFPLSQQILIQLIYDHLHQERLVAPWGSAPVLLTAGVGAYNYGNYSNDILAANAEPLPFDIHWCILSGASANDDFEVSLVYGAADTECAEISYTRTVAQDQSASIQVMTGILPGGSRIRARCRSGAGGNTISIKIAYHHYHFSNG